MASLTPFCQIIHGLTLLCLDLRRLLQCRSWTYIFLPMYGCPFVKEFMDFLSITKRRVGLKKIVHWKTKPKFSYFQIWMGSLWSSEAACRVDPSVTHPCRAGLPNHLIAGAKNRISFNDDQNTLLAVSCSMDRMDVPLPHVEVAWLASIVTVTYMTRIAQILLV